MFNPKLETFIRVADTGSFSKVACETFITPTAIIKQINTLEADLNVQLFTRNHQGVALTEAGRSFYKDAKHLIKYSNESIKRTQSAMQGASDVIRIGISAKTSGQFLIELWPVINEQYPDARFQMVTHDTSLETQRDRLANLGQSIDAVIGPFDDEFLKNIGCAALEFSKEPLRCAVPIYHKFASKKKLTIQDFYDEDIMMIQRGWNSYMDILRDNLRKNHKQINIVNFEYYDMSAFNLSASYNTPIITIDFWKNIHPMFNVLPVEWDYVIPLGLLHSHNPSKAMLKFLDVVRGAINAKKDML